MPSFLFFWTDEIEQHLREHGVSTREFEFVVANCREPQASRSTRLPVAEGYTQNGRWLVCVYEMIDVMTALPVTAFEPEPP